MASAQKPPNALLRTARKRLVSPSGSQRPLSRAELATAVNKALADLDAASGRVVRSSVITSQYIGALERGEIRWPNREYRIAFCGVLRASEAELGFYIDRPARGDEVDPIPQSDRQPIVSEEAPGASIDSSSTSPHWKPQDPVTSPNRSGNEAGVTDELIDLMAERSLSDSVVATTGLDRTSMSDLFEDIGELARAYGAYDRRHTVAMGLAGLRQLQQLASRSRRRNDRDDLYLLLSLTNALLASAAFDLSRWQAAKAFARAARAYAGESANPAAIGWSCGLLATFLNWSKRPSAALTAIARALSADDLGPAARFRLNYIAARSYAQLGDVARAKSALHEGDEASVRAEARGDLLSEELGGEFSFGPARASACAGAVWLDLGDGLAAERALRDAVDLCRSEDNRFDQAPLLGGAKVDLASAMVLRGDLDAADDAWEAISQLPSHLRISVLAGRVEALQRRLQADTWKADRRAAVLRDRVGEWAATPIAERSV